MHHGRGSVTRPKAESKVLRVWKREAGCKAKWVRKEGSSCLGGAGLSPQTPGFQDDELLPLTFPRTSFPLHEYLHIPPRSCTEFGMLGVKSRVSKC